MLALLLIAQLASSTEWVWLDACAEDYPYICWACPEDETYRPSRVAPGFSHPYASIEEYRENERREWEKRLSGRACAYDPSDRTVYETDRRALDENEISWKPPCCCPKDPLLCWRVSVGIQ